MKLTELEASFFVVKDDTTITDVPGLEGAQGVMFLEPLKRSTTILVCFSNPRGIAPAHGKRTLWEVSGTGLHDLTINPSIDAVGVWHGWVKNGEAS